MPNLYGVPEAIMLNHGCDRSIVNRPIGLIIMTSALLYSLENPNFRTFRDFK